MRVGRVITRSRAEGPGVRFAIWMQGCLIHCAGCYATSLQDINGGVECSPESIIAQIQADRETLEGITLLGGEPFLQAGAVSQIAHAAQEMGLSVLTFTGWRYEQILSRAIPEELALLSDTDVLLDGPYLQELRDFSRPLIGSRNQTYRFLSHRYSLRDILACENRIELRIDADGVCRANGMGDFQKLEQKLTALTKTKKIDLNCL